MWKAKLYPAGLVSALGGADGSRCMDLLSDTLKMALFTSSSNAASDWDTIEVFGDITNEVATSGYTAGGKTLASKTITYDSDNRLVKFQAGTLSAWYFSTNPAYAVLYDDTVTDKPVVGYIDFGSSIAEADQGDGTLFGISWDILTYSSLVIPWIEIQTFSSSQAHWYGKAWENIFGGSSSGESRCTAYLTDDIVVSLHTSGYVPDLDADEVFSDTSDECVSGSYAPLTLSTKTMVYGTTYAPNTLVLDADFFLWTALDEPDIRWAVIRNDSSTDKPLLALIDLGGTGASAEDFKIQWNRAAGLLGMRHPI